MPYELPEPHSLTSYAAAVWIAQEWRPTLLDEQGDLDGDAVTSARPVASGGSGVMLDAIASLTTGQPFDLRDLGRVDDESRSLLLAALAAID
jgi:hypothetical protein